MTPETIIIRELADSESRLLEIVATLTVENAQLRVVGQRELHDRIRGDIAIKRLKAERDRLKAQLRNQERAVCVLRGQLTMTTSQPRTPTTASTVATM